MVQNEMQKQRDLVTLHAVLFLQRFALSWFRKPGRRHAYLYLDEIVSSRLEVVTSQLSQRRLVRD